MNVIDQSELIRIVRAYLGLGQRDSRTLTFISSIEQKISEKNSRADQHAELIDLLEKLKALQNSSEPPSFPGSTAGST